MGMIFTLTDEGESCKIEACSESQVFSIGDAGTNYCNVKLLVCGSDQGCKVANSDFTLGDEQTSKKAQASVNMGNCLAALVQTFPGVVVKLTRHYFERNFQA